MKKALVVGIAVMMSGMVSMSAYAGWQYTGNQWKYENNGSYLTGWQNINAAWYYFDQNGTMMTGWQMIGGEWYYLRPDGSMAFDQWVGAYYVGSSGAMAKNTWIGPYYVGADGKWIPNYGGGGKAEEFSNKTWLRDLETFDEWYYNTTPYERKDPFGNVYKAGSNVRLSADGYATYYTNNKYNVFSGTVVPWEKFYKTKTRTFVIEGDGEELYSLDIERTTEPEAFEVNIEGYKYVTIKLVGGYSEGNSVVLSDMCFWN